MDSKKQRLPWERKKGVDADSPLLTAALAYAARGWRIIPCRPGQKIPLTEHGCKDATTDVDTITAWWTRWPTANIALACGPGSGVYVVDVDLDIEKEVDGWGSLESFPAMPATVRQNSPRGGAHFLFRSDNPPRNKNCFRPGIDIRADGYYIMLAPSVHPNGKVYEWAPGAGPDDITLAEFPDFMRPEPAKVALPWEKTAKPVTPKAPASPDATPIIERARLYLQECESAVQGQAGHEKLLWAARALVVGFELDEGTAVSLLWSDFNPRCIPPWDRGSPADIKDFERKAAEARRTPGAKPRGWLLDELGLRGHDEALTAYGRTLAAGLLAGEARGEDLPEILRRKPARGADSKEGDEDAGDRAEADDPGQMPDRLLRVPGFVSDVMDYCLKTAPYPNRQLAFAGALALQAFLAGRKVRGAGDVRSNIYLVALAPSGTGKEWPRKLNKHIAFRAGFVDAIGDQFASSEGIEDALLRTPAMLFQTDEMDSILQSMKTAGDPRLEAMQSMMLTLYGESSSEHIQRVKAGAMHCGSICNPHMVIFGTAIPVHFYGALSERMMTNGLLSRLLILDCSGKRKGQDASPIEPPEHIIEAARWWREFAPGGKDLAMVNPAPVDVPHTAAAKAILTKLRLDADREHERCSDDDETGRAVWSRAGEHGMKLALIYAVSSSHENPEVDEQAARWGAEFAMHQARRKLAMAGRYGASSPFEKDCRVIVERLTSSANRRLSRSLLLKRMKNLSAKQFDERTRTLIERNEIEIDSIPTGGRPGVFYTATKRKARRAEAR